VRSRSDRYRCPSALALLIGCTVEVGDRREVRSRSNILMACYSQRSDESFKWDGSMAGFDNQTIKF
jgi:hypothetical protein